MKYLYSSRLAIAMVFYAGLALAQHGHGMGGSMGGGMASSHGGNMSADHGSVKDSGPNASRHQTPSDVLSKNSKLADKLQALTGMPAQQACSGFKNLGQCVAAAHVSKNLGISFACLKSDMTGQAAAPSTSCPAGTGSKPMSLGKSIQTLSPNSDHRLETKRAEKQANTDIKDTNNS